MSSPFTSLSHFFSISFGTVSSPSERLRRDTDRTGEEESDVEGTEGRADLFPVHLSPSGLRSPVMLGPSFRSLSRLSLTRFFGPSFVHSVRHERKERSVAE